MPGTCNHCSHQNSGQHANYQNNCFDKVKRPVSMALPALYKELVHLLRLTW